jgi:2'-5' RNA ligase
MRERHRKRRGRAEGGPGTIRAFVALPIPAATRDRVAEVVAELTPRLPGLRWTAPEGWHLTLRFLGPTEPTVLAALEPRLRQAAARCPPAAVPVGGLGMFPERGSPRILWLHVELPDTLRGLQQECEAAAVDLGFPPESRSFRSHLTLGRWRAAAPRPALPEVRLPPARLETLVLFKSELRSTGAVYTALAAFPLGGTNGGAG